MTKPSCAGLPEDDDLHDWEYEEPEPDVGIYGEYVCHCCGLTKEDDSSDDDFMEHLSPIDLT